MLFNLALFSTFCLVPMAVAFQPNTRLDTDLVTNTLYSKNWAGAVWAQPNGTFSFVTGTFTVPTPTGKIGDSAAIWVGIDGDTCKTAILQTGLAFTVEQGQPNYFAWYEWYPAYAGEFTGITFDGGDTVRLSVLANTPTSGVVTVENLTKDTSVYKELNSTAPLCGQNAEWIVEDFGEGNPSVLVPFANFSTVVFTDPLASGTLHGGDVYTPTGAFSLDIKQNNTVLTSTSISTDGTSVTINYV